VVVIWIGLLIVVNVLGQVAGSRFSYNLSSGRSPSDRAQRLLAAEFPTAAGTTAYAVIHTTGPVTAPASEARTAQLVAALSRLPHVSGVVGPFSPRARHQISPDGHIAFVAVQFNQDQADIPKAAVQGVVTKGESFSASGYQVALGGDVISKAVSPQPGASESAGIIAAMIIMLIAFGSVVAMGLPIITALLGIGIGFALEDLLSHWLTVPIFAPELLAMIGLGVGIDYALFIVTRYRQGLTEDRDPRTAAMVAHATSGRAVLFAGGTVIISLCGLFLMNLPFMQGLAISAIAGVVFVMLGALTLLPAMLGYCGRAIDRWSLPGLLRSGRVTTARGFWYRWSRQVQRHPWRFGLTALLVLVLLALPLFSMRMAFTDAGNDPQSFTTRQAYDLLAQGFGPGFNGPLVLVAQVPAGAGGHDAMARLDAAVSGTAGVAYATPAEYNAGGNTAVVIAYPTTSPEAAHTATLVHALRDRVIPAALAGSGVRVLVGGETAASVDAANYLSKRLFLVIGGVILLAVLLLLAVFRSVVVPIKAAIVNLLSVGAAYGVMVAVFQWGWAGSLIGIGRTGPIDPWIPLMMFTIIFGLSMDYEVFLLSRIREQWLRTGNNAKAVADGLARTARVITAAAAIMICVFGSFVIGDPLRVLKVFGLGLAVAVFLDATLVRMVLVPSAMEVLGKANWYMPRWLDRIVPHLGAEVEVEEEPFPDDLDTGGPAAPVLVGAPRA
jgi:RND superfamily putative drug exporter